MKMQQSLKPGVESATLRVAPPAAPLAMPSPISSTATPTHKAAANDDPSTRSVRVVPFSTAHGRDHVGVPRYKEIKTWFDERVISRGDRSSARVGSHQQAAEGGTCDSRSHS